MENSIETDNIFCQFIDLYCIFALIVIVKRSFIAFCTIINKPRAFIDNSD